MIELAEHILEPRRGHFDPAEFQDAPPATVVNLMDTLRCSIKGGDLL
jgi:non-homologous end joining protein Ku